MNGFLVNAEEIEELIDRGRRGYRVYGPVRKGSSYIFAEIEGLSRVDLSYNRTILPPKKLFHRPRELMMRFSLDGGFDVEETIEAQPIMLVGVHPCDLNGLKKLDNFFTRKFEDPYYLARRKESFIVGLNCVSAQDEYCFCSSLGTGPYTEEGYDLLLTPLEGDMFLLEVGSEKGKRFAESLRFRRADKKDFEEKRKKLSEAKKSFKRYANFEGLDTYVLEVIAHEVWDKEASRCLSCGSCSLVCPTCYCYEVYDVIELDFRRGKRFRRLDSCQLYTYAEVALGGNFRRERRARLRHWMTCKFGGAGGGVFSSCVGCGRCIVYCPVGIDITRVASRLKGG